MLSTEALAQMVADEWRAQAALVDFEAMRATRLAEVALDAAPAAHDELAQRLAEYANGDLLCYFADRPAALFRRQELAWEPLIAWVGRLGLTFRRTVGIGHVDQPPETLTAIQDLAVGLENFQLTGLVAAAQLFGSTILALALMKRRITGDDAFAASQIDETFQAEAWGEDAEASARAAAMRAEARMLDRWFEALI